MGWKELNHRIIACTRCPRLRLYCQEVARVKRRQFLQETYWGKPLPGFGDSKAKLWIFGLAPAAHGANRTGRMFTGDSSGDWLFRALAETGFANQSTSVSVHDGLKLHGAFISAAARCAPPDNKPTPQEIVNCSAFLAQEWELLGHKKILLALGAIGYDSLWNICKNQNVELPSKKPKFRHGLHFKAGEIECLASYHPSRQNTQTGRLTWTMWREIFETAKRSCLG